MALKWYLLLFLSQRPSNKNNSLLSFWVWLKIRSTQKPKYSETSVLKNRSTRKPQYSKTAVLENLSTQKPQYSKTAVLKNRNTQNPHIRDIGDFFSVSYNYLHRGSTSFLNFDLVNLDKLFFRI